MATKDFCNCCGGIFGIDCTWAPASNAKFLATLDEDGNVIQECCDQCQQEAMEEESE